MGMGRHRQLTDMEVLWKSHPCMIYQRYKCWQNGKTIDIHRYPIIYWRAVVRVSGDVLAVLNVIPQVGLTRLSPARRHNLGSDLSGVRLGPGSFRFSG